MAALPAPFPSHPSEVELIDSYLRPWIASRIKADEFIHEADLYGEPPGVLTGRFPSATAGDGREAWYFFTELRCRKGYKDRFTRTVGTVEAKWIHNNVAQPVRSDHGQGPQIGQSQTFAFKWKADDKLVSSGWMMVELRVNDTDLNALCKVYRSRKANADGGSPVAPMAGAPGSKKEDDEASAAGPSRKRKAGDEDSGAETAAVGGSAGAATTGELSVDGRASLDAAEEDEAPAEPEEPDDPSKRKFYKFL